MSSHGVDRRYPVHELSVNHDETCTALSSPAGRAHVKLFSLSYGQLRLGNTRITKVRLGELRKNPRELKLLYERIRTSWAP